MLGRKMRRDPHDVADVDGAVDLTLGRRLDVHREVRALRRSPVVVRVLQRGARRVEAEGRELRVEHPLERPLVGWRQVRRRVRLGSGGRGGAQRRDESDGDGDERGLYAGSHDWPSVFAAHPSSFGRVGDVKPAPPRARMVERLERKPGWCDRAARHAAEGES